jgi:hypothetical protein
MDITLSKVTTVALIQHKPDSLTGNYTTLEIETEKGKVTLDLFSSGPIALQLGRNEDD